jgi:hypothetical protein
MMWTLGSDVGHPLGEHCMKTLAMPASPGGSPFASDVERALWELGYANDFETEAEARAAIAELCATSPAFLAATFTFVEA